MLQSQREIRKIAPVGAGRAGGFMARNDASNTLGRGRSRLPLALVALFLPGLLFGLGLVLVRDHPRFSWLTSFGLYPWEFWLLLISGAVATIAGWLDWRYHRSGKTVIGRAEHHSELVALAGGGLPLFVLMAAASVMEQPLPLLIPVILVVLFTAVMICYDEFVFHRKRCGRYETILHRLLVFGNGLAWLAWMQWCFVREQLHG
jgi:hypothetical protein